MALNIIAQYGSRGPVVEQIQKQLNDLGGHRLAPDGKFGTKTLNALKAFQKENGFMNDGVVGPMTNAALSLTPFLLQLPIVPPHVQQSNLRKCWAAATASWLAAHPARRALTEEQIVQGLQEDGFARGDGSLPRSSERIWEQRFGLRPLNEAATEFFAETTLSRLQNERTPVLFGHRGRVGHVVVVFGVAVQGLQPALLVMDPLSADPVSARLVKDIHDQGGHVVTWLSGVPTHALR